MMGLFSKCFLTGLSNSLASNNFLLMFNLKVTIIKASNNRIRFEHPIVLDPDKKNGLGVSHLMFSLNQTLFIRDFNFDIHIPIPTTKETFVMGNSITGIYAIKALDKELQNMFNATYTSLIVKMEKDRKTEIVKAFNSATRTSVKFRIQKSTNNYVIVLNIPFLVTVTSMGNFAQIFKFENTFFEKENILTKADYVSGNIEEILKPLSVIEWHCNIAEFSSSNHDSHPHLYKQEELLHISFIDKNFYEKPVYKEIPKRTYLYR